eukprot:scaffold1373_cov367-Pinguiococcus_pyrenoidosus.AAC.12
MSGRGPKTWGERRQRDSNNGRRLWSLSACSTFLETVITNENHYPRFQNFIAKLEYADVRNTNVEHRMGSYTWKTQSRYDTGT